jgi:hypothetical protein
MPRVVSSSAQEFQPEGAGLWSQSTRELQGHDQHGMPWLQKAPARQGGAGWQDRALSEYGLRGLDSC